MASIPTRTTDSSSNGRDSTSRNTSNASSTICSTKCICTECIGSIAHERCNIQSRSDCKQYTKLLVQTILFTII